MNALFTPRRMLFLAVFMVTGFWLPSLGHWAWILFFALVFCCIPLSIYRQTLAVFAASTLAASVLGLGMMLLCFRGGIDVGMFAFGVGVWIVFLAQEPKGVFLKKDKGDKEEEGKETPKEQ